MPDQELADALEALRLNADLTLRELVKLSGVPRSTLSDALTGRRVPRLKTVLAIARACGTDLEPWQRRWAEMRSRSEAPAGRAEPADRSADPAPAALSSAELDSAPSLPSSVSMAPVVVPAQLPRDVTGFASRALEMTRLDRGGITVVHGRPGVGKSALAVHWAHSVAADYPDGQLFLNLRGHHPTLKPMSTAEAMGRLLHSLDVAWMPMTQDPDEGVNLWRSTLAGRKLLIVLDDAISADQVRPLLPGAPGCALVVTSRRYLAELVVLDGADSVVLDVLPVDSSFALLRNMLGASRVEAEPEAVATVAAACGHLPLALCLAGATLAGAPERTFAELVDDLADGDRLSALEGLTKPSAVEDAFELSYQALNERARFLFRRMSLHPGPDISVQGVTLLTRLDPAEVDRTLRTLAQAHLVEPARAGRYRMHDLLRDYAVRLGEKADTESERSAARHDLFGWFVDRALAVSAHLDKGRERLWVDETLHASWEPSDADAAAWLNAEYRNIIAVIEHDAQHGTGRYAWTLVDLIAGMLLRRKDLTGLLVAADAGLSAAQRHGERRAEGAMRVRRGWLRWRVGQSAGAEEDFTRAQALFSDVGPRRAEAAALRGLGVIHASAGRWDEHLRCSESALAVHRAEGDHVGEAVILTSLGVVSSNRADFPAAASYLEMALALHRRSGNRGYIALALANLAHIQLALGDLTRAREYNVAALDAARRVGDAHVEVLGLTVAALIHEKLGEPEEAYRCAVTAVERARALGYHLNEAISTDALATAARQLGRENPADLRKRALARARDAGEVFLEAEILIGVARDEYEAALALGNSEEHDFGRAREAAQRALDTASAVASAQSVADALCLLAACDLTAGEIDDALAEAGRSVEMHVASGARLAEVSARNVRAHALLRSGDYAAAGFERHVMRYIVEDLALPAGTPARRLLAEDQGVSEPPLV